MWQSTRAWAHDSPAAPASPSVLRRLFKPERTPLRLPDDCPILCTSHKSMSAFFVDIKCRTIPSNGDMTWPCC